MAGLAASFESDPAFGRVLALRQLRRGRHGVLRRVAIAALDRGVFSFEWPSGGAVIELVRAALRPRDHIEVGSRMVRMARRAIVGLAGRMKASVAIDQPLDVGVTGHAPLIHRAFALTVTGKALERRVELFVGARKGAGRHLGVHRETRG